jgi:hypothetical protein
MVISDLRVSSGWRRGRCRVVVDVGLLGVIPLLVLLPIVVAVGQRSVIVDVGVPGGPVLELVATPPGMVVANVPVIVSMLGRRVGVLRFLPLALSALSDGGHGAASFRVDGCLDTPAWDVPITRPSMNGSGFCGPINATDSCQ